MMCSTLNICNSSGWKRISFTGFSLKCGLDLTLHFDGNLTTDYSSGSELALDGNLTGVDLLWQQVLQGSQALVHLQGEGPM